MRKVILILLIIFFSRQTNAQIDSTHFLNFYYGLGTAVPLGSLSKQNPTPCDFGKVSMGFNMKAGAEFFINPRNAVSFDMDYGFFFPMNDSLVAAADRDVLKYGNSFFPAGGADADLIMAHVCIGYARLVNIGKFALLGKICVGKAQIGYDFNRAYAITSAASFTSASASSISSIIYGFNDLEYYTAKPEIGVKYIIVRNEKFDWMLGFNVGYFYAHPVMNFYSSRSFTPVRTLDEELHVMTLNLSIQLTIKKPAFQKLRDLF